MKFFIQTLLISIAISTAVGAWTFAQENAESATPAVTVPTSVEVQEELVQDLLGQESIRQGPRRMTTQTRRTVPARPGRGASFSTGTVLPSQGVINEQVLVVPSAALDTDTLTAIREDMTVMGRIFAQKVLQRNVAYSMIGDFNAFAFRSSDDVESIYLQGYGALFKMEVGFPFLPPIEGKTEEKTEEPTDQIWEQTKKQIYQPAQAGATIGSSSGSWFGYGRAQSGARPKYDAEKVQELKRNVLTALKHAANIRQLQPDEWVVISIKGTARPVSEEETVDADESEKIVAVLNNDQVVVESTDSEGETTVRLIKSSQTSGEPTFMTIRVKHADILDWAADKLNFDEFSQKASILTN